MLQSNETRRIVQQIEDDKSSLLWLWDEDSCHTVQSLISESSALLDVNFDFNHEVFSSRAYRTATRANIREALSRKKGKMTQREGSHRNSSAESLEIRRSTGSEDDAQTIKAKPKDPWSLRDDTFIEVTTEINQIDSIISDDNVTNDGIERSTRSSQDNTRKEEWNEPSSSLKWGKPLPAIPSRLNRMVSSRVTEVFSPTGSELFQIETQRHQEYSNRMVAYGYAERRDSLSFFGLQGRKMPKPFNLPCPPPSDLPQQPRTSQVPSAGIDTSHLPTYEILRESRKCPKVLVLGISGAGKTTLLKSMKMFLGYTYGGTQREGYRYKIYDQVFSDINTILGAMEILKIPLDYSKEKACVKMVVKNYFFKGYTEFSHDFPVAVNFLWNYSSIRAYFRKSKEYCCMEDSFG